MCFYLICIFYYTLTLSIKMSLFFLFKKTLLESILEKVSCVQCNEKSSFEKILGSL